MLKKKYNGAWSDVSAVKRKIDGSWVNCTSVKKKYDGTWSIVYPSTTIRLSIKYWLRFTGNWSYSDLDSNPFSMYNRTRDLSGLLTLRAYGGSKKDKKPSSPYTYEYMAVSAASIALGNETLYVDQDYSANNSGSRGRVALVSSGYAYSRKDATKTRSTVSLSADSGTSLLCFCVYSEVDQFTGSTTLPDVTFNVYGVWTNSRKIELTI